MHVRILNELYELLDATWINKVFYFFLKRLSGPESQILESDWLIPRAPAVQIFQFKLLQI